jgi:hypothetical protein
MTYFRMKHVVELDCTRSSSVPRLLWLSLCGTWNFLRYTGGVHRIHTQCSLFVYVLICIWDVKVFSYPVKLTKIIFSHRKRKQPSLPSRNNNLSFLWWPHYTPPHSHRSRTRLPASVTQFRYPLLTVFPVWSFLYAAPPTLHQRFLACTMPV